MTEPEQNKHRALRGDGGPKSREMAVPGAPERVKSPTSGGGGSAFLPPCFLLLLFFGQISPFSLRRRKKERNRSATFVPKQPKTPRFGYRIPEAQFQQPPPPPPAPLYAPGAAVLLPNARSGSACAHRARLCPAFTALPWGG